MHYLNCLRKRSLTKYFIPSELGSRHSRKRTTEVVGTTQKLYIRNGSERFLKETKYLRSDLLKKTNSVSISRPNKLPSTHPLLAQKSTGNKMQHPNSAAIPKQIRTMYPKLGAADLHQYRNIQLRRNLDDQVSTYMEITEINTRYT